MRRLRVLIAAPLFLASSCGTPAPEERPVEHGLSTTPVGIPTPEPSPAASKAPPSPKPSTAFIKVGEVLDEVGPYYSVHPDQPPVTLGASGKPTILFFWNPSTRLAREELLEFEAWVASTSLREKADVYSVVGTRDTGWKPLDVRDVGVVLGIEEVPILTDPEYGLARRLGVQNSPEIVALSSDVKLLAKQIRALEHGRLRSPERNVMMDAKTYLADVAATGTGPEIPRTMPYFPSEQLVGHKVPDVSLHEFSAEGAGKGALRSLRSLLTGKRPAVILFFSSTCKHCQVDMPQIAALAKARPEAWDIVGVTAIKNDQHRTITARYLEQLGISFPVLEDAGAANDLFRITSTPTDIYVAANGTVGEVSYYQHKELEKDWDAIAERLAKLPPGPELESDAEGWRFPLRLSDEAGAEFDLASFEGKPSVLHFWATWCQPCREELPNLLAQLPELERHGNVALITVEDNPTVLRRYRSQTGLDIQSYLNPHGGLAEKLNFGRSVPRTYVLDAHGNIQQIMQGTYEWDDPKKLARVVDQLR